MRRPLITAALLGAACTAGQGETMGSLSGGGGSSTTSGSTTSSSSTTADPELTTADATTSLGTTTTPTGDPTTDTDRMDLARDPDLGLFPGPPPWCSTRKVDFVFQISSSPNVEPYQDNLLQSFGGWIDTIEELFPDFDVHVLVSNTWGSWGNNSKCFCLEDLGCDAIDEPNYPCWAAPGDKCDNTRAAGIVLPAGKGASNKLCGIPDGRRYLISGDPKLKETFGCLAQGGYSNGSSQSEAMMEIVKPYISAPGACNAGFLRYDSLLFITIVEEGDDGSWSYNPTSWAEAVHYWREDPETLFVLGVLSDYPTDLEEFLGYIEHHHQLDIGEPNYVQGFTDAIEMALKLCEPPPK
ncbi:MAG: hypothetical protein R3B09_13095 [Nannocystaceae bacterium]